MQALSLFLRVILDEEEVKIFQERACPQERGRKAAGFIRGKGIVCNYEPAEASGPPIHVEQPIRDDIIDERLAKWNWKAGAPYGAKRKPLKGRGGPAASLEGRP
jgi:hypothetical protein